MSSVEGALTETTNFLRRSLQTKNGRAQKRKVENGRKTWVYTLKEVFGAEIELKLYILRFRILNGQLSGREQNACSSINSAEDQ